MAIISQPVTKQYEDGFDKVDWSKKDQTTEPTIGVTQEYVDSEGGYYWVAKHPSYPTLTAIGKEPAEAYDGLAKLIKIAEGR